MRSETAVSVEGNGQLAALMRQAGFLKDDGSVGAKVFARAVGRHSDRSYTHTYVKRWLEGVVPRDTRTRQAIAAAIGERLGRTVEQAELGFGSTQKVSAELGLRYPDSYSEGVTAVAQLWQADHDRAHTLRTAPVNIGAWNEAALSWLVATRKGLDGTAGERRVGDSDIAGITNTVDMFDQLDGRHGGGHARRSLIEFLRSDLTRLLRSSYSDDVGKELYRAASQAVLLGAWMTYDAGVHGLAQRYFIQALKLAEATSENLRSASVLDAMSHQATFLGNFREAANLARTARMGTEASGSPCAQAHFYAMEARALARLGERADCDRAMAAAVREFERRDPDNDPADWFDYFDDAELAAELGHCNRDLGRSVDASTYAEQSIGDNGEYVRSDFFVTMVLADSYLDQGEAEEACRVALRGLEIGENLKSARCRVYVDEFRQRLQRLGNSPVVRDFNEQARAARLWTAEDVD